MPRRSKQGAWMFRRRISIISASSFGLLVRLTVARSVLQPHQLGHLVLHFCFQWSSPAGFLGTVLARNRKHVPIKTNGFVCVTRTVELLGTRAEARESVRCSSGGRAQSGWSSPTPHEKIGRWTQHSAWRASARRSPPTGLMPTTAIHIKGLSPLVECADKGSVDVQRAVSE